jgi:hypothetical protein
MPTVPPVPLVRAVEGLRARITRLNQRLVPGPLALLELILGGMVSQTVYAAAELGIADAIGDGALTATEIADRVGADPDAVDRLLRFLSSWSVFAEKGGRYTLTPMAAGLRSDAPMSMLGIARLMGHPTHWEDWGHLVDTVRTGEPTVPARRGMGAFEYLAANPEYAEVFFAGMGSLSELETVPLTAAYDFSRFGTIVDFCGGRGALLAEVLGRAPRSRGVLVDERAGGNGAAEALAAAGVADRCTIATSGLFDPVPAGGDAYLLKHVVHDWPQAQVAEILKNVRAAINPDGRLLLMEFVVPTGRTQHISKLVDLWLMLLVGGRERTEEQYAAVLADAGFQLSTVVPTASPVSIIEARPV